MNAYESTMNFTRRAVWAQIDLDAAAHNMRQIRKHVGPDVKIAAVVKANAYGHGSVELAKTFAENGADCFAVSSLDEAVELRRYAHIDKEIFILGHTDARRTEELLTYDIEPAVFNLKNAEFFSQEAQRLGKTLRVHIAVDTGMSRVGFQVNEFSVSEIKAIAALPNIEIRGMFTHFAVSDIKDKTFTREQYGHFRWMCKRMEEEGIHIALRHCCNSAAIMELDDHRYDMVRSGIVTYGIYPSAEVHTDRLDLRPALAWKAHVIHLQDVPMGTGVGYGATFVTERPVTRVATVSVGYADGYPRALSSKGCVLIRGKRAPILGRICMDQMMVDVTDIPGVAIEDIVTLIGKDGDDEIPVEEVADPADSFNYEMVCRISPRVTRRYI